jgi:A/G-specific adenine glycosylase
MLQQTQVDRVAPRFAAFVAAFPTAASLAAAKRADVLRAWRGLGYNVRAIRLHAVASQVAARHRGRIPRRRETLLALPGVGAYTASALRAFAYDLPDAPMDVNLRRVVHRLCWGIEYPPKATADELQERALALVPARRAHDWSSALMDLGASICTARAPKCLLCPLREHCKAAPIDAAALERARSRSRPPKKSVPFEQTARYARGRIVDRLRELPPGQRISLLDLHRDLSEIMRERTHSQVRALVVALAGDGLVAVDGDEISLP